MIGWRRKGVVSGPPRTDRTIQRARETFLAALARGISITGAANEAGLGRRTVYDWRDEDPDFAAAWNDALEAGADILEDEARRRAADGVDEPVIAQGRLIRNEDGTPLTVKRYSDTLMTLLLKGRRPNVYRERVSADIEANVKGKIEHAPDDAFRDLIAAMEFAGRAKAGDIGGASALDSDKPPDATSAT